MRGITLAIKELKTIRRTCDKKGELKSRGEGGLVYSSINNKHCQVWKTLQCVLKMIERKDKMYGDIR